MKGKLRLRGIVTVLMMLALVCVPLVGKATAANLELDDQEGQLGGQVTFTLSVNVAPNEVTALGVDIGFDPTVLEYIGGTGDFSGTLLEAWSFKQVSTPAPGVLRLGGFTVGGAIAPGASGSLVKLAFDIIDVGDSPLPLSELKDGIAGWTTKDGTFTYLLPAITGVNPDSGSTQGGQSVTITGENFFELAQPPTTVKFGGVEATGVSVVSSTQITCTTPEHPDEGLVDVMVTNPDGMPATLAQGYEYVEFGIQPATVSPCGEGATVVFSVVPEGIGVPPFTWRVDGDILQVGDETEFKYTFMEVGDFTISVEDASVPPFMAQATATVLAEDESGELDVIGGVSGMTGQTLTVEVQIQNAPNQVSAMGADVVFDGNILNYQGHVRGELVQDFDFFDVSNPGPGVVRMGGFEAGDDKIPPGASGVVVELNFDVNPDLPEGECIWDRLELQGLKDDIGGWSTSWGCVLVNCRCTGDVNGDGEITPADALCAFETFLEICPTSCGIPCDQVCGDVNQDGEITPGDALCIFEKFLELPSCLD